MIDRAAFTPDGSNPPYPVPCSDTCTVPTEQMAYLLAQLCETKGYVLEIGTGSGYQTAILSEMCEGVVSLEQRPIRGVPEKLGDNVVLVQGVDGCTYDTNEKFDAVLVTFACHAPAESWINQLKTGGRLIAPIACGLSCPICVWEKIGESGLHLLDIAAYAPFTGRV